MEMEAPQNEEMNGETVSGKQSGVGSLLSSERELRGLSIDQVAQITRLRVSVIEALENEEWDKLPALVFVKGFVRSYAKALGFDDKGISELYRKIQGVGEEQPRPLIEPARSNKRPVFLVLLLLILGAVVLALWTGYPNMAPDRETVVSPPATREEPEQKKDLPAPEKEGSGLSGVPSIPPVEPAAAPRDLPARDLAASVQTDTARAKEAVPAASPAVPPPVAPAADDTQPSDGLVLKASVTSRTWLRILIDGQEPKEYIFQTGARPQWKAKEGFDIIIGNAAGIEFEFNGEQIKNLGTLGQVVKLRLPKNFRSRSGGD